MTKLRLVARRVTNMGSSQIEDSSFAIFAMKPTLTLVKDTIFITAILAPSNWWTVQASTTNGHHAIQLRQIPTTRKCLSMNTINYSPAYCQTKGFVLLTPCILSISANRLMVGSKGVRYCLKKLDWTPTGEYSRSHKSEKFYLPVRRKCHCR